MSALTLLGWIVGVSLAIIAASVAAAFATLAIGTIKAEMRSARRRKLNAHHSTDKE